MKITSFILLIFVCIDTNLKSMDMDYKKACELLSIAPRERNESREAFANRCKKQYRKYALELHPDKNSLKLEDEKNKSEEKFKEISNAYDYLINSHNEFEDFTSTWNFQDESREEILRKFGKVRIAEEENVEEILRKFGKIAEEENVEEVLRRLGYEKKTIVIEEQSWSDWLYEKLWSK